MPPLAPDAFEEELARYLFERSEEARAVGGGATATAPPAACGAR